MSAKVPNPIDAYVGSRVRTRRLMLGMSQERLAEQIGVTFQQVQKYEKGTNRIGASRLQAIAGVLAVPVAFFFQQDNSQPLNTDGLGAINGLEDLSDFLTSKEGLSLNKAFMKINDPSIRQSVLTLIKSLANASDVLPNHIPHAADASVGLRN
ncbi:MULTISPECIES: helix-turn-helix domain-containing protein [Rhizobium]|uniref:Helix-turn-helix transcriptional regulator n=1 Tax=Rhizobium tropici TaxID=398 RepID=A0A6P1C4H5_RHITR|nr:MULTISPECIES: helix-turn-helix transcriptional regulator [Rhizobium]MBB3384367.1 transcriptional regulator with XRE-family HTH domain [Rhizobium sp. BK098]MBB3570608.1 transcriptional regulator with XRE-family HTH domain [Rhizobium sp. BK491]AGB72866.1 transcriptional regulator, XRE family [Rhizobium tropici CIAT 899]MBB3426776.1 transcriptional regulator with XRE-family HTH domain [Rhizobium sp. BK312]MBB4241163.1 transcriptional regulator with XRE-family HTH domain [Rhizobium tropici]